MSRFTHDIPSIRDLMKAHENYMLRLPAIEREQSNTFTESLNIFALSDIASRALASECVAVDKIYQGGFNQIFNLSFRDEKIKAIARVNMPYGGGVHTVPPANERKDRVQSEAATLKWLHAHSSIPVPRIFTYDPDPCNNVGAAYIIEERILGRALNEIWGDLSLEARHKVVKQLAHIQAELLRTSFSMIGSLYEDTSAPAGSPFRIGRRAPPVQIERNQVERGPWATPREFFRSLITEQLQEITSDEGKVWTEREQDGVDNSAFQIDDFKQLYAVILHLVNDVRLLDEWEPSFCLTHPDLTTTNILVDYADPTSILAIIDWEGARIQPWWFESIAPEFIWEELENPPPEKAIDIDSEITWSDVCNEWNDIVTRVEPPGLHSEMGYFLSRLHCLVDGDYATWVTSIDFVVDFVMEWRRRWPQLHDPAFGPLDSILREHRPDFSLEDQKDDANVSLATTTSQ